MKCGTWILYQKYKDEGYTKSVTFVYDKAKGRSSIHTYWTQKYAEQQGKKIINLFENDAVDKLL